MEENFSCDINLPGAGERAELEVMEKALDLDGQIMTLGPTSTGRWKIRNRQPVVLLKDHHSQSQHDTDGPEAGGDARDRPGQTKSLTRGEAKTGTNWECRRAQDISGAGGAADARCLV